MLLRYLGWSQSSEDKGQIHACMASFRPCRRGLNVAAPVLAATCNDPGGFEKRLGDIRREAAAQGISQPAINAGLSGIAFDPAIIRRDRAALLSAEFRAVLGQDGSGVSDS